ncbi:fumarate hydratase [candidate division MSBL1 archaeon SCGC-AAA382A13]|uniref:Fumarate hydratase n=1 Tax=candidate division MSBL1 archaeon SCGC-AAA382A13 TaxID=1698279 RepID=A0A133VFX9_9EURY|nr:fumarate hydratase [candidate division MSBL1 archaeon SCGC-AAA382A13]
MNDVFQITGTIFTARDAAHKKLISEYEKGNELSVPLEDYPCFHCGPVMQKTDKKWNLISAGPTTSIRMEIFESEFMDKIGTRMFIGKGGMGEETLEALGEHGGIYAQLTGGAGSVVGEAVEEVSDVFYLDELGIPEAVWILKVKEFGPLLVTMDSHGSSLHEDVSKQIESNLKRVKKEITEEG